MFLEPPKEIQLEFIKKENFYHNADKIDEDIDVLIDWLSKQPHLPNVADRVWLKHFLIGCKNNLQRTKKVLESYFVVRADLPELFDDLTTDAEWAKNAMKIGKISLMPKMTPEANRVHILRTIENNDSEFNAVAMCKGTLKTIDYLMRREPIYGMVFIFDLQHCQLSYLLSFTPSLTKNLMRCIHEATPLRVKGIHYVNPPKFVSRLVSFFKMFLPTKIQNRILIHENFESLHKHIPKDVLPNEYGGTAGSIEKLEEELFENFKEDDESWKSRPQADLSKRPAQEKSSEMDMSGTFKKLNLD
ncbi:alpha-tocopherol transfer protein-like [Adelges cooleyi]|uniref:alpha-tocopherol transfer protein-like n=1 Tax=Adelges cooleyi TaxID=133065 RepID=UPI0021800D52|nr:alpha-tocopherol transfer protein-like [Adelges cooleyi]